MDRLPLAVSLFEALDASGISYVHWKSNEHLPAALAGETDLDLLVDPSHTSEFLGVIERLAFVALEPPASRKVPGLDGFLGFDTTTGALLHLDVHYRLVLGEQLVKNHHLPIESWLLETPGRLEGVAVPRPERELLMLYVRSTLKTTNRQLVRSFVKGGSPLPDRIRREAAWLAGLSDRGALAETARSCSLEVFGEELVEFHRRCLEDDIDWRYVRDNKRSLRRRLRQYERLPRYLAGPKKTWLRVRSGRWMHRMGLGIPPRHLAGPAPVVAAVGADGSGKSRLTRDLESWLGRKLVVHHVYFGQPKSGLLFKIVNKPGSVTRKRREEGRQPGVLGPVARYTDGIKWLALGRKRRRLARRSREQARRGEVVIAERYPLQDFHAMETPMDGPRLQPDGTFARAEMAIYRDIAAPDLTIVLDADVSTLRARKLDLTRQEHEAKVAAVRSLATGNGRIFIDAGRPYDEVLLEAKTEVWKAIRAGS